MYGWKVLSITIIIYYILILVIQRICVWRKLGGSGLALCVPGLSRDFLVSTTIIDEDWVKPCGFTLQNIKFSDCPCFQGKKKNEWKKSFRMYLSSSSMAWQEWSLFIKRDHPRENCRLGLCTIKAGTALRVSVIWIFLSVPKPAGRIHLHDLHTELVLPLCCL